MTPLLREKWSKQVRKELLLESSEKLRSLIDTFGKTKRANRARNIVDDNLEFIYEQACEILYSRDGM